ncbi:MAG: helix-turn-helix transcriptional regulator [Clostridia bacterium]
MFYDNFLQLCNKKGLKPSRVAIEAGIAKSAVSNWRYNWEKGIEVLPTNANAKAISDYFGVTVDYLFTGEQTEKAPSAKAEGLNDEDIKIALFGGDGDVTDEMWEEALNYAAFIKDRELKKREANDKAFRDSDRK